MRSLLGGSLGEESSELVLALADDDKERAAELVYQVIVALRAQGIPFDEVRRVLATRRR